MDRVRLLGDFAHLAETVLVVASDDTEPVQTAMVWVLLNRARQAGGEEGVPPSGVLLSRLCGELMSEVKRASPEARTPALDTAEFCRALATVCLVCSGDIADPTQGATRFHRHDEMPEWARLAEPRALLGRRFYY